MDSDSNNTVSVVAAIGMLAFLVWLATQMAITPENAAALIAIGGVGLAGAVAMALGLGRFTRDDRDGS
jgi:hypothetical protein